MDDQELGRRRREAWEMAQAPRTMAELLAGVPELTSRDVRKMVDRRELARVGGCYKAVTPTPRHEPPPQAVLAPSVWAYARRCA
jgi:hypothetical protein